MEKHIRVLIIEDSENDMLLIVRHLRKGGFTVDYLRVETEKEMTKALRNQKWDIIISDYALPGFSGLDAVIIYKGLDLDIPFILVSGSVGEHLAVMAMKAGAHDYLMKDRLERLAPAVERELLDAQMRRDKKKNEEAYRTLVENSLQGLVVFKEDRILFANRIVSEISGYSVAELLSFTQEHISSIIHPEDRERILTNLHNRIIGKPVAPHSEFRMIHKSGAVRWVEIYSSLIDYRGEKAVQVAYIDITERKGAEELLRISEKKFRDIFTFAPVGIYQSTHDGCFIKVNAKLAAILGYDSTEELLSKNLATDIYFDPDERDRLIQEYEPKSFAQSLEVRWKKKDESPIWIEMTAHAVKNLSGNTEYFEGFIIDITERKQSEIKLKESEEQFRSLAEKSPNMIFINQNGKIVYANKKCEEIMGYSQDEFLSPSFDFRSMIAKEYHQKIQESFALHLSGKDVAPYVYVLNTKDGKKINAINSSKIIHHKGTNAILGIVTDITERKRIEEEIRKSEEKYRLIAEKTTDVIWLMNFNGESIYVSPSIERFTGYTPSLPILVRHKYVPYLSS